MMESHLVMESHQIDLIEERYFGFWDEIMEMNQHMMDQHRMVGFHHMMCFHKFQLWRICVSSRISKMGFMRPLFVASIALLTLMMTSMGSTIQFLKQMGILLAAGTCSNCFVVGIASRHGVVADVPSSKWHRRTAGLFQICHAKSTLYKVFMSSFKKV